MNLQSLPRLLAGLLAASLMVFAGTAQGAAPGLPTGHVTVDNSVAAAATPQPLVQRASEEYLSHVQFTNEADAAAAIAPVPTDFDLIRPGQLLLTTIPGQGTFICSASFVFKDNASPANYYLATAGHCVMPPTAVATHGVGANYNPSGVVVNACYRNCVFGGELSGLPPEQFVTVGPVVYARQSQATAAVGCTAGQIGNDFALVKINPALYPLNIVTPRMAVWSGPYVFGLGVEGTGKLLVHHGNGIELGTVEPTKARAGVSLDDGILCSFQALISVAGGDSGSAISLAMAGTTPEPVLSGGEALGTITHALGGAAPPAYGTTVYRAINMAKTDANLTISLCMASTTIPGC
jgi:hypothetical protein